MKEFEHAGFVCSGYEGNKSCLCCRIQEACSNTAKNLTLMNLLSHRVLKFVETFDNTASNAGIL